MVHFRRARAPGHMYKMDALWQDGAFVGYRGASGEFMVAARGGVFRTRNVRRKPMDQR